ncbi:glycosyltransferase family 2 protein [Vibrio cyclitrophicus]
MLVSVVIPSYNSSKYMKETLCTVYSQTYAHIEVIIVDDHSDDFDDLVNLVSGLAKSNLTLFRQPKNLNGAAARNKGVELSKGDLICFLDADDLWEPTKIAEQVSVYKKNSVVTCKTKPILRGKPVIKESVRSDYDSNRTGFFNLFSKLEHNLVLQTSSIMISREDFYLIGGFDESLFRHQDFQLVYAIDLFKLNVIFVDKCLSYYVKDDRTAIQKGWSIKRSEYFIDNYREGFKGNELLNFLIIQLMGPSIKCNSMFSWLRLCHKYKVGFTNVLFLSICYLSKRLFG